MRLYASRSCLVAGAKPRRVLPRAGAITARFEGDANGAPHTDPSAYAKKFAGKYTHRNIKGGIGHNLPQEAPQAFAKAVVEVDGY